MLIQVNKILNQAAARITASIADFLPGVLALLVVMLCALVLAWIARFMIRRALRGIDFDKRLEQWGCSGVAEWSPSQSPTQLLAASAYWFIILAGLLVGLSALNATVTSALVLRLFEYFPNVVAALLIVTVGIVFARFAARGVLISAVNMQVQSARLLSLGVKWLVTVLAGAMALEHLGIGGSNGRFSFGILFGGVVVAPGLGGGGGAQGRG